MCTLLRRMLFLGLIALTACNSDDLQDDLENLGDLTLNPPERKEIDTSLVGVNAFFNVPELGSFSQQFSEIRDTLNLRYVRVLFAWTTGVQPSPEAAPDFGFYDEILQAAPPGVDILVVLAHTPDWITDSRNWIDGSPTTTWVERWLRPNLERYAGNPRIIGWEIFNEPDSIIVPSDVALGLTDPAKYFALLQRSSALVRELDPTKLVVLGATRSIQQGGGANLDYNRALRELGALPLVDVWAIHYYGKQFEQVVRSGGVKDFLNGLGKPIWLTESGEQGFDQQLQYAEITWPFLKDNIPAIERIYYYQFEGRESPQTTFALRTPEGVSNLYLRLRDGSAVQQ